MDNLNLKCTLSVCPSRGCLGRVGLTTQQHLAQHHLDVISIAPPWCVPLVMCVAERCPMSCPPNEVTMGEDVPSPRIELVSVISPRLWLPVMDIAHSDTVLPINSWPETRLHIRTVLRRVHFIRTISETTLMTCSVATCSTSSLPSTLLIVFLHSPLSPLAELFPFSLSL